MRQDFIGEEITKRGVDGRPICRVGLKVSARSATGKRTHDVLAKVRVGERHHCVEGIWA